MSETMAKFMWSINRYNYIFSKLYTYGNAKNSGRIKNTIANMAMTMIAIHTIHVHINLLRLFLSPFSIILFLSILIELLIKPI